MGDGNPVAPIGPIIDTESVTLPDSGESADDIVPDNADWTWVLERDCPDCGFAGATFDATQVGAALRENAAAWCALLTSPVAALRERRTAGRWSDLEYAAHVRDVFVLFGERLALMLTVDDPLFDNWDQDRTAVDSRYRDQDPAAISCDLADAAQILADAFDAVVGVQWSRTGRRSDGARFTVESFARYLLHDPVHHLWDVTD